MPVQRPETAKLVDWRPRQIPPLTPRKYLAKHIAVALLGEGAIHKMGLENTLSLTKGLGKVANFIPTFGLIKGAEAARPRSTKPVEGNQQPLVGKTQAPATSEAEGGNEAPATSEAEGGNEAPATSTTTTPTTGPTTSITTTTPTTAPTTPTTTTITTAPTTPTTTTITTAPTTSTTTPTIAAPPFSEGAATNATATTSKAWCDYAPGSALKGACNSTSSFTGGVWSNVSSYLTDNAEWLLLAGGVAVTSAAINRFAAKRIRNPYARNIVSVLGGATAVWGIAFGLSYLGHSNPIELSKAVDVGARLFAYHGMLKMATPLAQTSMFFTSRAITSFNTPYAFQPPRAKTKNA